MAFLFLNSGYFVMVRQFIYVVLVVAYSFFQQLNTKFDLCISIIKLRSKFLYRDPKNYFNGYSKKINNNITQR